MIRSVDNGLVADGLIASGSGMIRSVDDGLAADGLVAYGSGVILERVESDSTCTQNIERFVTHFNAVVM